MTIRLDRSALIIVAVLALVVGAVTFALIRWNHREAEHKASIAAAQSRYTKFKSAIDNLDQLYESQMGAWEAYNRDENSGSESSQQRHDYLTSGNSTDQHVLSLVTNENNMANRAELDEGSLHDYMLQTVDVYEGLYGVDATKNLRADEMRRDQLILQSLSYWQRVSEDIKDSVRATLDGNSGSGESSDEINNLYEQASQVETEAKTVGAEENHESALLGKRLRSDTARAKSASMQSAY